MQTAPTARKRPPASKKPPKSTALMFPEDGSIPEFLLVKNRRPLTPEQQARLNSVMMPISQSGRVDWNKPKGMSVEEWEGIQAPLREAEEQRKRDRLTALHDREAKTPKTPRAPGYKGHIAGSRKARVHECRDAEGDARAIALAKELGLKEGTAHAWLMAWAKVEGRPRPEKLNGAKKSKPSGKKGKTSLPLPRKTVCVKKNRGRKLSTPA